MFHTSIGSPIRRGIAAVALGLAVATAPVAIGATSASAAPYCGITWGSLAKASSVMAPVSVTGLRVGTHPCYDRLVVDVKGKVTGYNVSYVSQVTAEGSGMVVPTAGGAKLQVTVHASAWKKPASSSRTPICPLPKSPSGSVFCRPPTSTGSSSKPTGYLPPNIAN